jgi:predicted DNA-binding antitoxin AbrB/MazE fold protein
MSETVDAIYDGGVLKPVVPLLLPDGARVTVTVGAVPVKVVGTAAAIAPRDEWERKLLSVAVDCGVSLPDSALSSEQLYE